MFKVGQATLRGYGVTPGAPSLLLIPSLINRYTILDLTRRLSFARFLQAQGFSVFVVDWGMPAAEDAAADTAFYVTDIVAPMAQWISKTYPAPLVPIGYCMGGLLALALAQLYPKLVAAAAFLATPWDFHAGGFPRFVLREAEIEAVQSYLSGCATISPGILDTLFHCANPYAFSEKLYKFARMDENHAATKEFLAIENWVNDGVPMTRGVAQDCLIGWTQYNKPANRKWEIAGEAIIPEKLTIPCFCAVPRSDRIVPEGSALPLVSLLHKATLIRPAIGHIGMMAGSRRKASLWEPFNAWLKELFA